MNDDLFELPSKQIAKRLLKEYREAEHPRDENGRWTAGGVAGAAIAGGTGLGAAALLLAARGNPSMAANLIRRQARRAGTVMTLPLANMMGAAANQRVPAVMRTRTLGGVAQRDAIRQARGQLGTIASSILGGGGRQRAQGIGSARVSGMAERIRHRNSFFTSRGGSGARTRMKDQLTPF